MMRRFCGPAFGSLLALFALPAAVLAQSAVTITGHVAAGGNAVRGATVRIDSLDIGGTTDAEGRYSFIVPSTRVRGQTVTLTARYPRFRTQNVPVQLTGGSLLQDFELTNTDTPTTPGRETPTQPAPSRPTPSQPAPSQPTPSQPGRQPTTTAPAPVVSEPSLPGSVRAGSRFSSAVPYQVTVVDSSAFTDLAGPTDLPALFSGRFAGLDVQTSSSVGGTSTLVLRGERSISGNTQPLVVVDGIIADNSNVTTMLQRQGRGGFDYGTSLNDFNPDDVAQVQLLRGPAAALLYGGRGANGVLLITTRKARGLNGLSVAANQQYSANSIGRRPEYQNSYGQGLQGKFSFFDGKGGGVNDSTDQSWGPALDGAAVTQASRTLAARPAVRAFLAQPGNVDSYFANGHNIATNVSVQGGDETGHVRGSVSNRSQSGVTPGSSVSYRTAVLSGGAQPGDRLTLDGSLQYYNERGQSRSGSGFDESNVVSTFSHMPRQVDVAGYQNLLRDATGAQLSWNYAGRNNPWFATSLNDNHDGHSRFLVGGSGSYQLTDLLTATARLGTDHTSEQRDFSVATGWMGGFPYYAGRGDFSTGGFESDAISRASTNGDLQLRAAPRTTGALTYAFTGGAGIRADNLGLNLSGSDRLLLSPTARDWTGSTTTTALYGGVEAGVRDLLSIAASVRHESASPASGVTSATLYPAVLASIDLTRLDSTRRAGLLSSFVVRGGWSKSGSDATGNVLQRFGYADAGTLADLATLADPEVTTGWEIGSTARFFSNRLTADLTYYNEHSDNLLLASAASYVRGAMLSNKGVEAGLSTAFTLSSGIRWSISGNIAKNTNNVEGLPGGATSFALAPTFAGLTEEAIPGSPLGALVGYRFLRDASGSMILRAGHPLPDSVAGPVVLGNGAPSWIGGLSSTFQLAGAELAVLLDAHHGGQVFSASNRAGAVTGAYAETSFRPDTGLLITGVDAVTGTANTTHVSTEDYYHALGAIPERWIYDASFVKLREIRLSYTLPLAYVTALRTQSIRLSVIGRNLALWTNAPNIDPESVLSTSTYRGIEMGQLPSVRSYGFQLSLTP